MRHVFAGPFLAAAIAALGGCSANSVIDRLPSGMAEPAAAPARPANDAYQYPAVHDMPPSRADQPLSEEQQVEMEQDLQGIRDRQEKQLGVAPDKSPANPAKKKPAAANTAQTAGSNTKP